MRPAVLALGLAATLLNGCAGPLDQPPEEFFAAAPAGELASCVYRRLRAEPEVRMTAMPDGTTEITRAASTCGLFGCTPTMALYLTEFSSAGAGRTRIQHRERVNLVRSGGYAGSGMADAVRACTP